MARDRRARRDLHALDGNGMVLCNPRDREAAHRADIEGIATAAHENVTCKKCLKLLHRVSSDGGLLDRPYLREPEDSSSS